MSEPIQPQSENVWGRVVGGRWFPTYGPKAPPGGFPSGELARSQLAYPHAQRLWAYAQLGELDRLAVVAREWEAAGRAKDAEMLWATHKELSERAARDPEFAKTVSATETR